MTNKIMTPTFSLLFSRWILCFVGCGGGGGVCVCVCVGGGGWWSAIRYMNRSCFAMAIPVLSVRQKFAMTSFNNNNSSILDICLKLGG